MSISGPLYRRTPRLFSPNKPGEWSLVWCDLSLERGELVVALDPDGRSRIATIPVKDNRHYTSFRMIELDRMVDRPKKLEQVLKEDKRVYDWEQMEAKLQSLAELARVNGTGKLVRAFTAVAIVGCIRFLRGYYFIFVTQRRKIGCIGGNSIYGISATQQLNLSPPEEDLTAWSRLNRWFNPSPEEEAEARYLGLFHFLDLTKDFYFSYSYDITHTLQHNMTTEHSGPAEMFTWNSYLTQELRECLSGAAAGDLVVPLVLGCYEQRKCSVFGRLVSIVLLARRSRHFAGTRYLKRGVADTGKAANDVETEQIIEDESMGPGKFSSFVQHRGSIPVFWSQETSATLPKPPIVLNRVDPTYNAMQKHFADLFSRYGSPIVALNLVKQSEKKEREVIVGNEYMNAVEYLNSFMPPKHRVRYVALDYSRLSGPKQKGLNVLHSLDKVAVWALTQTGFFCSAPKRQICQNGNKRTAQAFFPNAPSESWDAFIATNNQRPGENDCDKATPEPPASPTITRNSGDWLEQRGILRTNCIDCLDRTNVSQFSVGMRALGQQLYVMGIKNTPLLESRSQLVLVLMKLYSLMGDAISMQYGGSEAHKNVKNSAARENVKHRELLTSIRRYYSNSFTDTAKQDAINIFLGHFVPSEDSPPLWELDSDYYLHNFEVRNGTAACENEDYTNISGSESRRASRSALAEVISKYGGPQGSTGLKAVVKRKDDQISIEDYMLGRGHRKFVGDCSTLTPDPVYQQYVLGKASPQIWENDNESVKMYFDAYMRDNNISPDDARSLRDAQIRGGATFKLQAGPYSGLDQSVKARVLVAKKLKTEPEDRKIFEESLNLKKLVKTGDSSVPAESLELYKTFFDEELPGVEIYRATKPTPPISDDLSPPINKRSTSATALSSELAKSIKRLSQHKKGRTRFSGGDIISVGPLFKMDGGKDRDFIVFNEAAAENSFGEVTRNETELSFYSK
ncbi:hypothetical protein BBJ29_008081 [Phytophthora kernoviae]|uniref:SAC domain-containing protein n=1 Tax=Phytophthora kernoviae TaxID=325452 RepID=A0A3R7KLV6_9STRA|nr:hypothetical protein BBJ29_008081 [Phytophthora kernoviae]